MISHGSFFERWPARILAVICLIVLGEALWLGGDVLRTYADLRWGQPIKTAEKESLLENSRQRREQAEIHRGAAVKLAIPTAYFPCDGVSVSIWEGIATADEDWLAYVMRHDDRLFTPSTRQVLSAGETLSPFFRWLALEPTPPREVGATPRRAPSKTALATVVSPGGYEYVIAPRGNQFVFIPIADYRKAGLPMHQP